MEFQEVTELVLGKKYKVIHYFHEYTATYKRSFHYNPVILTFSAKGEDYHQYIFPGDKAYKYYVPVFKKEYIQLNMEQRALQRILQKIIGDPTFTWVGTPYNPEASSFTG